MGTNLKAKAIEAAALDVMFGESPTVAAKRYGVSLSAVDASLRYASSTRGIYALRCPVSGKVRYVGSSERCEQRFEQHKQLRGNRGNPGNWMHWLMGLRRADLKPIMEILEVVSTHTELTDREAHWLTLYRAKGESDLNVNVRFGTPAFLRGRIKDLEYEVKKLHKQVAKLQQTISERV